LPSANFSTTVSVINRDSSNGSEDTDDKGIPEIAPNQQKFDPGMQKNVPRMGSPKTSSCLVKYSIVNAKTTTEISAALLADGRKWKKSSVTQRKQYGEMRYTECQGSFRCNNTQCPFRVEFG